MSEIPSGYCRCECGGLTNKAPNGQFYRYIKGHQNKGKKGDKLLGIWKGGKITVNGGYVSILLPNHLRADSKGYVREHIVVAEKALGKLLTLKAVIHHHNGNVSDNRPSNLVVCQDTAYHRLLHQRMEAYKETGHANWLKCKRCKLYDNPKFMRIQRNGRAGSHRECENQYEKERIKNLG